VEAGTGIASGHSIVSELGFLSMEKERDEESSDPSHYLYPMIRLSFSFNWL